MNTPIQTPKSPSVDLNQRQNEDIFALASAPGMSPIAIIRVSGSTCFERIAKNLVTMENKSLTWNKEKLHSRIKRTKFLDSKGQVIDDIVSTFFFAPQSYTGQNSLELYPHGSTYIVQKIFETLRNSGFRDAEPGEFTERAFFNGKLDLSKAEGIQALIEAQTEYQWMSARSLSSGNLHDYIFELRKNLIDASAFLEALIDFPEESDVSRTHLADVVKRVDSIKEKLVALKDSFNSGRASSQGVKVVLAGKTNAGKSSLLNKLVGSERAIVSPIAGTTRDYIEENVIINGIFFRLIDTAGLRETEDAIENIGISLSKKLIETADIVLYLIDSTALTEQEIAEFSVIKNSSKAFVKLILTKVESHKNFSSATGNVKDSLAISVQQNLGILELKNLLCSLAKKIIHPNSEKAPSLMISQQRHYDEINCALGFLDAFYLALNEGKFEECLAFELQEVVRALSRIIGTVEQDEILESIFSNFCVGK